MAPVFVDTHCHLDAGYFPEGPEAVMHRAGQTGVRGFVVIGVGRTLEAAKNAVLLAGRFPKTVRATVGVHPHDASTLTDALYEELRSLASSPEVVAVGEIGLDYHYDHSPREIQGEVFARLIALARSVKKPIVVHTRSAPEETLRILESERAADVGGIVHCFSEDIPFARRALDLGFDLSFSGILTFKNARAVQETAAWAPDDRILLETDSPYLAPVPFRGKPNEPAYLAHTAQRLADLRKTTLEHIGELTTQNAERRIGRPFDFT